MALLTGTVGAAGLGLALMPTTPARADGPPGELVEQLGAAALEATDAAISAQVPQGSLAPLIKRVQPAVVSVRSFGTRDAGGGWFGGGASQPFQRGVGSGFIIDPRGVVVTNHHVVAGADQLQVKLDDGRLVQAKVLGSDPYTDLAVLQLDGVERLPHVRLGNSQKLEVGDFVLAIGSPMGLEQTVTRGIVSAKGRGDLGLYADSYVDFVQTDAAISPGSSGGPLINMRGEVVAVNTAVSGIGRGLGFAVPVDQVKTVVPQLREHGKVERGWLGVAGRDLEPALGQLPTPGAVVGEVVAGAPAAAAGLRTGDRIVRLDGVEIENFSDLRGHIAEHRPGDKVELELERDGHAERLMVTLGDRTGASVAARAPSTSPTSRQRQAPSAGGGHGPDEDLFGGSGGRPRLGVEVLPRDGALEVRAVLPGSLAEQVGLQPGDVLESINGKKITGVDDVAAALGAARDEVRVEARRGDTRYVGQLRLH